MRRSARRFPTILILVFFFNDTATTDIYTLSLHDALPISRLRRADQPPVPAGRVGDRSCVRRPGRAAGAAAPAERAARVPVLRRRGDRAVAYRPGLPPAAEVDRAPLVPGAGGPAGRLGRLAARLVGAGARGHRRCGPVRVLLRGGARLPGGHGLRRRPARRDPRRGARLPVLVHPGGGRVRRLPARRRGRRGGPGGRSWRAEDRPAVRSVHDRRGAAGGVRGTAGGPPLHPTAHPVLTGRRDGADRTRTVRAIA